MSWLEIFWFGVTIISVCSVVIALAVMIEPTMRNNNMTLTEYLEQDVPKRMPTVMLQPNEYIICYTLKCNKFRSLTLVKVNLIEYDYVFVEDSFFNRSVKRLYTVDEHGNPNKPSCFWIKYN